ncbi:MAG: hypothetical protein D3925_02885 [Candidatus Electrothrix sp. AR5]|nr:hypothetical protein [Candidatus Electrothrix sp. AR5]
MKCPKCKYKRTPKDDKATSKTECPSCGVIYTRYIQFLEKKRKAAKEAAKTHTLKGRTGQIHLHENGVELTKSGNEEPKSFTFSQIKDIQFTKCTGATGGFFLIQDIDSPAYTGGVFKAAYEDHAVIFGTANPKALFSSSICDEINNEWNELRNAILLKIGKEPIEFPDKETASGSNEKTKFNYKYAGIAALLIFCFFIWIGSSEDETKKRRISSTYSATGTRFISTSEWYEGGSLHRANIARWNNATYSDKLATCADMALTRSWIKRKIQQSGDMDTLRPYAQELMTCINTASDDPMPEYEHMKLSEFAAMCMILMKW